jgi:hypothetical protein
MDPRVLSGDCHDRLSSTKFHTETNFAKANPTCAHPISSFRLTNNDLIKDLVPPMMWFR